MNELSSPLDNAKVDLIPTQIIATFPENTFLESIVITADNQLYISDLEAGRIYRLTPQGEVAIHAQITGRAAGLEELPDGQLLLSGWNGGGIPVLWTIAADGAIKMVAELREAMFLNGITALSERIYLIADSYRGAIWQFDLATDQTALWFEHPLLGRSDPNAIFPAVNGLKIYDRVLYASNTEQQTLLRIPLDGADRPGKPEVFVEGVNIDDFAFDIAGNLYGTTHIFNSVIKISPTGEVTILAEAEQGMVGSTALAFARGEQRTQAYVVTNGGLSFPPPTGLETAKVVKLAIGQAGLDC